jgi:hypothetical protein
LNEKEKNRRKRMKRSDAIKTLTRRRDWLVRKLGDPKEYDGKSYDVAECAALSWVLERIKEDGKDR